MMIDLILWAAMIVPLPLLVGYIAATIYSHRGVIIAALLGKVR
jgi:hypothetical protein